MAGLSRPGVSKVSTVSLFCLQGIGDSAQGLANIILFCALTKPVRTKLQEGSEVRLLPMLSQEFRHLCRNNYPTGQFDVRERDCTAGWSVTATHYWRVWRTLWYSTTERWRLIRNVKIIYTEDHYWFKTCATFDVLQYLLLALIILLGYVAFVFVIITGMHHHYHV